jgi:hypothetical protein
MRIMLKLVLDCAPDAAWRAIRSPEVFQAVSAPFTTFTSLEPGGFPKSWPEGAHPVRARAFGIVPMGDQVIDISFARRGDARLVHDTGGGLTGAMAQLTFWHHTMAVSATPDGRTLFRDRLLFDAAPLTLAVWPALWVFWQWRAYQLRRLARGWGAE